MSETADEWHVAPSPNGFTDRFGPLQRRWAGDRWLYALRVDDGHRNEAGLMHGGAMTALIDEVIGTFVTETVGRRHVTVQLATTFLKPVQVGELVEVSGEIVKVTGSMTFVEAKLRVSGSVVATATLIFKAIRPRAPAGDTQGG
ncbi:PaaI family thioesterase [Falsiroseomonas oryzae]|uniref:PaaI family thioesterase n=1 Tax=Falsiroseomonas oryzae TaxID=2766473 RepID=UPI0022EB4F13|nr:PaaI family thioesterase [Roseomonas sp. MO-31]